VRGRGPKIVKFEIQIYKTRPGSYIVDIQRLEGHVYSFLDVCGELAHIILEGAASSVRQSFRATLR
jgi:Kinase associated domain 1